MSAQTEHDLTVIEHLDWALPCGVTVIDCSNPATYLVVNKCCGHTAPNCGECVSRKVASPPRDWKCTPCGGIFFDRYLDLVTLHPLGGAS